MCGIAALLGHADPATGERIATAMHHRGPDDHGVYTCPAPTPLTLVSTRLAIIDLSPNGHMPMHHPAGLTIVFNGEVYNFADIRAELETLGHTFTSSGDTEVVLAAYAQWGDACLDKLRGMFAFFLWDAPNQRLLAARDRLGIKPIYYARTPDGALVLASELKAILASGHVPARLNHAVLPLYLSFYNIPAPHTILDGVHALLPGHKLVWQGGDVHVEPWWALPPAEPTTRPYADLRDELRHLLEESVRLRMIADVPVGAFLSGGVDSSAIVALMTRISGRALKTFSVGFEAEGAAQDERSFARLVAERYGADHHEVIVTGQQVADQLNHIITALDQPSGDALNTFFVSQATRQHVTVALSGVGGDELFAGYPQFRLLQQAAQLDPFWRIAPAPLRTALAQAPGRVRRIAAYANADAIGRYQQIRTLFSPAAQTALLAHPPNGHALSAADWLRGLTHPAEPDVVETVARWELTNYMPNMLLRDTDAMSMAHSLEVRVPLIDHKVVEFVRTVPTRYKLRNGQTKILLTDALRDLLPDEVITRPKRGFEMPIAAWLRGPLRPIIEDALSDESIRAAGLFNPAAVAPLRDAFLHGRDPVYLRVWSLTVLELYRRRFLG